MSLPESPNREALRCHLLHPDTWVASEMAGFAALAGVGLPGWVARAGQLSAHTGGSAPVGFAVIAWFAASGTYRLGLAVIHHVL